MEKAKYRSKKQVIPRFCLTKKGEIKYCLAVRKKRYMRTVSGTVCALDDTDEITLFKKRKDKVVTTIEKDSSRMSPVKCVF